MKDKESINYWRWEKEISNDFQEGLFCGTMEKHILLGKQLGRETTGPLGNPAVLRRELYILYQKLKGTVLIFKQGF